MRDFIEVTLGVALLVIIVFMIVFVFCGIMEAVERLWDYILR